MRWLLAPALLWTGLALAQGEPATAEAGEWNFAVTLDGRPIGMHRFTVSGTGPGSGTGAERTVDSRAQFDVRLLGFTVYRYRHHARERWRGDCLRELRASTDDDGKPIQVDQRFDGDCLMGFAYWNPRLLTQQRLVDPQTGRTEAVRLERLPDASVDVQGQPVAAKGWRLLTDKQRITLWYAAASGRWIALDAVAAGGRMLSYRLPAAAANPSAPSSPAGPGPVPP